MTTVRVFAPAKINLTLHVTGRRADGYHLLDTLVAFAPVGDWITIRPGNLLSLTVEGPEAAGVPADIDNIALRAAMLASQGRCATIVLKKFLPVASGIGGGSSDAAAAFRGMMAFGEPGDAMADTAEAVPGVVAETHARALLDLGADVPMCIVPRPLRAGGIGEKLEFVSLPPLPAVLVNPRVPVPTGQVFKRLESRENPAMPEALPDFPDAAALIGWLAAQRNDLESPAIADTPEIPRVLDALRSIEGCALARMSGSGATCFGLFPDLDAGNAAAEALRRAHPDWWIAGGLLGDQRERAAPQLS